MQQEDSTKPVFPILVFTDELFVKYNSEQELTRCTPLGLNTGFYEAVQIYDYASRLLTVKKVIRSGSPWLQPLVTVLNMHMNVQLEYAVKSERVDFSHLCRELIGKIRREENPFAAWDVKQLFAKIKASTSVRELIDAVPP